MKLFLSIVCIFGVIGLCLTAYGVLFGSSKSIFTFRLESTQGKKEMTYEEMDKIEKAKMEEDILYTNRAMDTGDITLCKMIQSPQKAENCHFRILALQAIASGSIETCDTIPQEKIAITCRDSVYQSRALERVDPSLCQKISGADGRNYCHENVDDTSLRAFISSGTLTKEKCQDFSPVYQKKCNVYISEQQTNMTIETSIRTNDTTGCMSIGDGADKDLCFDTIFLLRATTEGNPKICNSIGNTEKKEYCILQVEGNSLKERFKRYIVQQDREACKTLADNSMKVQCNDTIIFSQIAKTKDANLCNNILNPDSVSICQRIVTQ